MAPPEQPGQRGYFGKGGVAFLLLPGLLWAGGVILGAAGLNQPVSQPARARSGEQGPLGEPKASGRPGLHSWAQGFLPLTPTPGPGREGGTLRKASKDAVWKTEGPLGSRAAQDPIPGVSGATWVPSPHPLPLSQSAGEGIDAPEEEGHWGEEGVPH